MPGCAHCGGKLDIVGNQVGRRDTCPHCGEELRSCRNCRHFDPTVAKECNEPFAEVPSDKDSANFCEFFQFREIAAMGRPGSGGAQVPNSRAAFDALFKKK